jgi:polysaccharide biosynthesis/export protein
MKKLLLGLMIIALIGPLSGSAAAQTDYRVGAQDVLNVTVFGETELSGNFTVEQDGTFMYPFIGRVQAGGKTLREIEQEIKTKLADGYLKNPQVTVNVGTYRSQRILILGEVRSPGEYQLTGDMTLLSALARAGSTTPSASHQAIIVRMPPKSAKSQEPQIITVDLNKLQAGDLSLNIPLQDHDTISVPKEQSVFVSGQVKAPGAYPVDPGTTVLQALALAGGLTDRGADGRIKIQRNVKGKQTEIKVKLTDPVEPGDTIIVPEKFF